VDADFPDACSLIAECEGKEDVPLTGATPGLQALINLLVKRRLSTKRNGRKRWPHIKKCEVEMRQSNVKTEAHRLIDDLPDDVTWDDVLYRLDVRRSIAAGLEDIRAGRVIPEDEVWKEFGLWP